MKIQLNSFFHKNDTFLFKYIISHHHVCIPPEFLNKKLCKLKKKNNCLKYILLIHISCLFL